MSPPSRTARAVAVRAVVGTSRPWLPAVPLAVRAVAAALLPVVLAAALAACDEADPVSSRATDPGPVLGRAADPAADAAPALPATRLGGSTMGTSWSAVLPGALAPARRDALRRALEAELADIDAHVSTWNPASELSRFNRGATTAPVALDADTLRIVDAALDVTRATGGAYDVTLGALVELWGFGATPPPEHAPDDATIRAALAASGPDALRRGTGTLAKTRTAVHVDLSSLAKGRAVDRLGEVLEAAGHDAYAVEIGGEVRTRGTRADGGAWRIGIERPDGAAPEGLALGDAHVASSGSYRNVRDVDGRVVPHILDGRTGRPVTHSLVAVTVLHPESTMLADAWATALLVLGPEAARAAATARGLTVQLVTSTGGGRFDTWRSAAFAERVAEAGSSASVLAAGAPGR